MKPRHLKIEGFLSYQQPVEIDFTEFDLACITGDNGAGKSSILDAMTWVLFGKARQSNESLINLQSDEAVVNFSFEYSGESYKIKRSNKRGKPARLTLKTPELDLTERTTRDTQNKIEQILKIDYETFCHAVFFLQGDSDKFVTATPGKRKQVLFDILGLDAWEKFRQNAAAEIKTIEKSMEQAQGSVQVLEEGIARGPGIALEAVTVDEELLIAEKELETFRAALDDGQKKMDLWEAEKAELAELYSQGRKAEEKLASVENRLTGVYFNQKENDEIISRKDQITKDYARSKELDKLLEDFRVKELEHEKLQHTLSSLETELQGIEDRLLQIPDLEKNITDLEKQLKETKGIEIQISDREENQIKWGAEFENGTVKAGDLLDQITRLEGHSTCPLCDQDIADPTKLIGLLKAESEFVLERLGEIEGKRGNAQSELDILKASFVLPAVLSEKIVTAKATIETIQKAHDDFDLIQMRNWEGKIKLLGYDKAVGMELRNEADLVSIIDAPRDHGLLEGAEKAGESLEAQAVGLRQDLAEAEATTKDLTSQLASKESLQGDSPITDNEMAVLKYDVKAAKTQVQVKTQRIGELNQLRKTIDEQLEKLKEIKALEKENTELHQKYSILQEAFSKKGVPALLVEQSLPQIESKANQLLHRLSDGDMAVHFITQKAYSDGSREDMKETLDIEIQDQFGIRDYEMYSGGESFRINFAIRMALSNVLANRAGAKLRTLVIDEGFGSQDAGGRDRLINAINTVKEEYDKVLVITHIPEVIESFPVQIRVEKSAAGSQVRIL